jgi:hypothetical protein
MLLPRERMSHRPRWPPCYRPARPMVVSGFLVSGNVGRDGADVPGGALSSDRFSILAPTREEKRL